MEFLSNCTFKDTRIKCVQWVDNTPLPEMDETKTGIWAKKVREMQKRGLK